MALIVAGCAVGVETATVPLPAQAEIPQGWSQSGSDRIFDGESVYELVDGQADAYFAYNFEQVAVRNYEHENGDALDIEIWRLGSPADAYGLFTGNRAGQPIQIGNGGDTDPGRRLAFWQSRYYIRIRARQDTDDDALRAFAGFIAAELPAGGERPGLIGQLPPGGLMPDSEIYFHLETSIQDWVWLGGENVLGLDLSSTGVLARYELSGTVGQLLLVTFDDEVAANDALQSLHAAAIDALVASGVERGMLAAVFGDLPTADARSLVAEALADA